MKPHWLDIQSFVADQRVLSAIDDLAIAVKFELSGVDDPERRAMAEQARRYLRGFLKSLGELRRSAEDGILKGVDPRSKELLEAYGAARQDAGNFRSALMRAGTDAVLELLDAQDTRSRRELLDCLGELRSVVERHQQTDISAILEEI